MTLNEFIGRGVYRGVNLPEEINFSPGREETSGARLVEIIPFAMSSDQLALISFRIDPHAVSIPSRRLELQLNSISFRYPTQSDLDSDSIPISPAAIFARSFSFSFLTPLIPRARKVNAPMRKPVRRRERAFTLDDHQDQAM